MAKTIKKRKHYNKSRRYKKKGGGAKVKYIYISYNPKNTKLGDSLFVMIYLYNIKEYLENNDIHINFYIRSNLLNDIKEFSSSKNIHFFDIDEKPSTNLTDVWVGNCPNQDKSCWAVYLVNFFKYIKYVMKLPSIKEFSYTDPDLLDRYKSLDDKYKNIDILIINGQSYSGVPYDKDKWDSFIKDISKKYNIVTTDKVENIKCTRDDNLSIKNIAAISTSVKYIIAVHTGPLIACFNTYALKNVKKWYIYPGHHPFKLPNFIMDKPFEDILNEI
jgi:hypothetical protein